MQATYYQPGYEVEYLYSRFLLSDGISIDTRSLREGNLFFALPGRQQNGHIFVEEALSKGASYAVISEKAYAKDQRCILVDDVLRSLQSLACFHRSRYKRVLIAVTGSCGKTTTCSLLSSILSRKYVLTSSEKSYNNLIGVPLTLLSIIPQTEVAVVELGISQPSEMASLCEWSRPTHGIIMNVGASHLEGLSNRAGVFREKRVLFDFLKQSGGVFFRNTAVELLQTLAQDGGKQYSFPQVGDDCPVFCEAVGDSLSFRLSSGKEGKVKLFGAHHSHNLSAAVAIAQYLRVEDTDIIEALRSWRPLSQRCEWIQHKGRPILLDSYNSNPDSMRASIAAFAQHSASPKALILGDMLELGNESDREHLALGKYVASTPGFSVVLLCGKAMRSALEALPSAQYFPHRQALQSYLKSHPIAHEIPILIKASRGMALEQVLDYL